MLLSAGSINSPKILQLSGVGNAIELKNNGIEVISFGEIIRTSTLKILSKNFKIKKPLVILKVDKIKKKQKKDYKLNLCM